MEMVRFAGLTILCVLHLGAAEFSLTIGNPIAANIPRMKTAALAVRLDNCGDLSKAGLIATAEGMVGGSRKSVPLQVVASATPGAYGVGQSWPLEGAWVVNLRAACGNLTAGAVVPFHGTTFVRESVKIYPRYATSAEVEGSLNELSGGRK